MTTKHIVKLIGNICIAFAFIFFHSCATAPNRADIRKAEAHNKLGYSYLDNGQLNEAFIEFQKAVTLNPENKETLNYLGYISAQFKNYNDAFLYYNKAISLDSQYSDAMNNLGVAYAETKQWQKAIESFKAALDNSLYSTPSIAYSNMGYAYYMKEDYENAERTLKEALIRNPLSPRTLYILGLVYVKTENQDMAIDEFRKAIGIQPDYIDAHWALAGAYMKSGKKAKALKHFKAVLENDVNIKRRNEASELIDKLKY